MVNDTAPVALEAGNSPEAILGHYRELVGPDDAAAWFGVMPEGYIAPKPATPTAKTEPATSKPLASALAA